MRKTLLILIAFYFTTVAFGQGNKEAITKAINKYFLAVENHDFEGILNGIPEPFFDIMPKEMLMEQMEETFNDEDIKITIFNNKINSISEVITYKNNQYALINYSFDMIMKMKVDEIEPEDEVEEEFDALGFTLGMLQTQFGEENVTLDREKKEFLIKSKKDMYGILYADKPDQWKFIGKEEGMEAILSRIVPDEVVKQLN